jgi:hypothetical protein
MRPFSVVVVNVLTNHLSQVTLTERDSARETFSTY